MKVFLLFAAVALAAFAIGCWTGAAVERPDKAGPWPPSAALQLGEVYGDDHSVRDELAARPQGRLVDGGIFNASHIHCSPENYDREH